MFRETHGRAVWQPIVVNNDVWRVWLTERGSYRGLLGVDTTGPVTRQIIKRGGSGMMADMLIVLLFNIIYIMRLLGIRRESCPNTAPPIYRSTVLLY